MKLQTKSQALLDSVSVNGSAGFLAFVLHAHLPFVRHPEYEYFFEENWYFEALTECYIPLIDCLDRLLDSSIQYRLTISLSPTLLTMFSDELLNSRYLMHMEKLIRLAEQEIVRTRSKPEFCALARLYRRSFVKVLSIYQDRYDCNLIRAFNKHRAAGNLELITTTATHAYLPLLNVNQTAVRAQIENGMQTFAQFFDDLPQGFWLPECGFYPGLESELERAGVKYFFVDSHGINASSEDWGNGVYAPVDCGNGVAAFGRDPESSEQVWSAQIGYPGDFDYRDFYSDIGYELSQDYLKEYVSVYDHPSFTGIKYKRITGDTEEKAVYRPKKAREKITSHVEDFISRRKRQINKLSSTLPNPPIIVAPYDAELFGHWWFEGTCWLEMVIRRIADDEQIHSITCSDYMNLNCTIKESMPAASSWGSEGYSGYWLNETNEWIYPLLNKANNEMERLVLELRDLTVTPLQERALNQALRSILLAQASDWPFIMKSGAADEYARKKITDHLARFNYLHDCIRKNRIDERYLSALEIIDAIFPEIDFRRYRLD